MAELSDNEFLGSVTSKKTELSDDQFLAAEPGTLDQAAAGTIDKTLAGFGNVARGAGEFIQAPVENTKAGIANVQAAAARAAPAGVDLAQIPTDAMGNPAGPAPEITDPQRLLSDEEFVQGKVAAARQASDVATRARDAAVRDGTVLGQVGDTLEQAGRSAQTHYSNLAKQDAPEMLRQQQAIGDAEGFTGTLKAAATNPLGSLGTAADSTADMIVGMGAGGVAAKGASLLTRVAAEKAGQTAFRETLLKAASNPATLADANKLARAARDAAYSNTVRTAAERAGASVALASEGASSAFSTRAQIQNQLESNQLSDDDLFNNSPRFRELVASGESTSTARRLLASELADQAAPLAALWTVGAGKLSGAAAAEGRVVAGSRMSAGGLAKNVGKETLEEAMQNPGEDYAAFAARREYDPTAKFDLGGSVAQGVVGGLGQGGVMHGAGYFNAAGKPIEPPKLAGRSVTAFTDQQLQGYANSGVLTQSVRDKVEAELARRATVAQQTADSAPVAPPVEGEQLDAAVQRFAGDSGIPTEGGAGVQPQPADAGRGAGGERTADDLAAERARLDAATPDASGAGNQPAPLAGSQPGGQLAPGVPNPVDVRSLFDRLTQPEETANVSAPTAPAAPDPLGLRGSSVALRAAGVQPTAAGDINDRTSGVSYLGSRRAENTAVLATTQAQLDSLRQNSPGAYVPRLGEITDPRIEGQAHQVADVLQAAFGVRPVIYQDMMRGAADGFALNGRAYVNAGNLEQSIMFTSAHEIFHVAEQRAKAGDAASQQFVATANTIFDMMSDEGKARYAREYLFKKQLEDSGAAAADLLNDPKLRSEMVADFFGKRAEDIAFMRHVAQRDPKGFGSFIRRWIDTLSNLIAEFKSKRDLGVKDVDQYIRKLSHAKAVAASALIEWRRSNPELAKQLAAPGQSIQFERKQMPPESEIVNPIDRQAPVRDQVRQLTELTNRNRVIVGEFMKRIDSLLGTRSQDNVKLPERIVEKARRPSIIAEKPWHDVAHIRDSYRFKTVLTDIKQLPRIVGELDQLGSVIKPDVYKVLQPKAFGWRIAVFDMKLKNGQLIEYYLPIRELETAKKNGGHQLFEQVRNLNLTEEGARLRYQAIAMRSRELYNEAWGAYLQRAHQTEAEVRASLDDAMAVASSISEYELSPSFSKKSDTRFSGDGDVQRPSASRAAENSFGPNTYATRGSESSVKPMTEAPMAASVPRLGARGLVEQVSAKNAKTSDVGHKRTADGRYVGAPDWVGSSPQNLAVMRKNLAKLAAEGEPGRMWYENSSKAILELAGGDKKEAERIVALIAIYSPNATVGANTTMALNAYFQYRAGLPIKAGLGLSNRKAEALLRENKPWAGVKTNSFYQNLMSEIDPSVLEEGTATMDMWMALAFDYGDKKLDSGPKYKFAEAETNRLASELGWSAHQVQAAVWTAIKARVESSAKVRKEFELKEGISFRDPEGMYTITKGREYDHFRAATRFGMNHALKPSEITDSKYDFSNALNDRAVQISWEATPGATTGVLPGVLTASLEDQFNYLIDINKALTTKDGQDAIAHAIGMPGGVTINGLSAWEGKVGAGAQTLSSVALQGHGPTKDFTPASKTLLDAYAAARGLILNQEAVVYHHPVWVAAKDLQNGVHLGTARPLNVDEMTQLYDALAEKFGTTELSPGYRPDGARILNFTSIPNKVFQKGIDEIVAALPDDFAGGHVDIGSFRSIGNYVSNNWQENPNGEEYTSIIAAFSPDLPGRLADLQARVTAVNRRYSEDKGWGAAERKDATADTPSLSSKQTPPAPPAAKTAAPAPVTPPDVPAETKAQATQRVLQDKFNRPRVLREWAESNGAKFTPASDVYTTEERMYGRMASRMEDFRKQTVRPLVEKIQKAGFTTDQVAEFLHAQHAQERNVQIAKVNPKLPDGGSGMKTADAQAILAKADPKLVALANEFQKITRDTRDLLLNSGIISKEMSTAWDNTYKHYVPLKGEDDEKAAKTGTGKGLSVNGRTKRALGHGEREEAILENILRDHERAIMLAEKNRVAQSMMLFAAELNDPRIVTVGKPEKRAVLMPKYQYDARLMNLPVATFDTEREARNFILQQMGAKAPGAGSMKVVKTIADQSVQYMASPMLQPNEANVYVNGHAIRLQFNDEILAREYTNMGVERLNQILAMSRAVNTYLSKAYTGYNPAFIFRNMWRDFGSGSIKITGNFGAGVTAKTIARYPQALGHLLAYSWSGQASPDIKSYRDHGGSTGAAYLSDIERIGADVKDTFREYEGVMQQVRAGRWTAAARVASKKTIGALVGWIEHLNMAAENAMRLALYNTLLKDGHSVEEAASAAKNATVNFNRKGEIGNTMGGLYLFFNPNIQDTGSIIRTLTRGEHKYQAWAVLAAMPGIAYALAALQWGGDDDDYERWKKIPDSVKDKNLVIRTGKETYITIPIPFGFGFFHTLGNTIFALEKGESINSQSINVAANFLDHFSPVGNPLTGAKGWDKIDGKAIAELTPGIGFGDLTRDLVRLMVNRNSFGSPIVPDSKFDEDKPDFLRMNRNTKGTVYDATARGMSDLTGGGKTYGGLIDMSPETLKFWTGAITGGTGTFISDTAALGGLGARALLKPDDPNRTALTPDKREIPILKDYLKTEMVGDGRRAFWDASAEAKSALADFRRAAKEGDEAGMLRVERQQAEVMNLARISASYAKLVKGKRDAEDEIMANRATTLAYKRAVVRTIEREEEAIYNDYLHQLTLARRTDRDRSAKP